MKSKHRIPLLFLFRLGAFSPPSHFRFEEEEKAEEGEEEVQPVVADDEVGRFLFPSSSSIAEISALYSCCVVTGLKQTRRVVRRPDDPGIFKIDASARTGMTMSARMQMARPFKRKTSSFARAMAGDSPSKGPT